MPRTTVLPRAKKDKHNSSPIYAAFTGMLLVGAFFFASKPAQLDSAYAKIQFGGGHELAVKIIDASSGVNVDLLKEHERTKEPIIMKFGEGGAHPIATSSEKEAHPHDLIWLFDGTVVHVDDDVHGVVNPPSVLTDCVMFGTRDLASSGSISVGDILFMPE